MAAELWLSIGLGAGIGLLYTAASMVLHRQAARLDDRRFLLVFLGGLIARMAAALILVVLVLAFVSVRELAFIGSFLIVFMMGLAAEVLRIHRGRGSAA
jgi:hypothetical protein